MDAILRRPQLLPRWKRDLKMGALDRPGPGPGCKMPECLPTGRRSFVLWSVSAAVFAIGMAVFAIGAYLETRNPRSDDEDAVAWFVLAMGAAVIGTGVTLPFARPLRVVLVALASPFVVYGVAVLALWAWTVMVEAPRGWRYFAALDAARSEAAYVSDFVRLFPGTEVRYRYFTPRREPGYDLHVALYERYELTMQLPVTFDRSGGEVVGYGESRFYLWEVSSVRGHNISYNPTRGREFGSAEWREIINRDGDFAAIGYRLIKDQPVPGLKDALMPKRNEP